MVDRRLLGPLALEEPPRHAAAGDPDRVPGDPQLVAGRDRRPPAAPTVAARVAEDARHLADRLALARLRAGRRGAAGADVRLGARVEHGERQPVGQRAILARPPVAQARLVAGVQLAGRLRRPLQARRHRQPQGVVGRVHEPLHRQVGHVERLAALVEAIGLAVLGQPVGDLRPRDAEQVAQGVLVLVAIEPPQGRPALAGQGRPLRGDDRLRQALDEGLLPAASGRARLLGGISPAVTRSCTLTQTARLAGSFGSNARPVRSSRPFLSSSLWQLVQWSRTKLLSGAAGSADRTELATVSIIASPSRTRRGKFRPSPGNRKSMIDFIPGVSWDACGRRLSASYPVHGNHRQTIFCDAHPHARFHRFLTGYG